MCSKNIGRRADQKWEIRPKKGRSKVNEKWGPIGRAGPNTAVPNRNIKSGMVLDIRGRSGAANQMRVKGGRGKRALRTTDNEGVKRGMRPWVGE